MKEFIYRIYWENNEHEGCYIGKGSTTPKKRLADHLSLLKNNKHHNKHFQAAFNTVSVNPTVELLCHVENSNATQLEDFHARKFETTCFNFIRYGAGAGRPSLPEGQAAKSRTVSLNDNDYNKLIKLFGSLTTAVKSLLK